jgi:hypothetical protein
VSAVRGVEVLRDALGRIGEGVPDVIAGLGPDELAFRPGPRANSIGWLVWHLCRVQDAHVAELLDEDQLWASGPWAASLGMAPDPADSGYGHSSEQVAAVRPPGPEALDDYHRAVWDRTRRYLGTLSDDDLDRIVDRSWDPPVTLGVRLVSIAEDSFEHLGQAGYVKGLLADRA